MPAIGIFDSGIGGLTVARAVADRIPGSPLVYFGDTAHLPYGNKSPARIRSYAREITRHLCDDRDCSAIVIACNSASANALEEVREAAGPHRPVIDVVQPVVNEVKLNFKGGRIGVIGTQATIQSGAYASRLQEVGCTVKERATPLLASAIEAGFHKGTVSDALLESYLGDGYFDDVDAFLLGCTHYPLIADQVRAFLPAHVELIDAPAAVASAVARAVSEAQGTAPGTADAVSEAMRTFMVSDWTASFEAGAQRFFGDDVELVHSKLWKDSW